jgi:hypothetical protein
MSAFPAGVSVLMKKVASGGPPVLWHGALAASGATFVGHYPWFVTRNYMEEFLPVYDDLPRKLLRAALIGFVASAVSDTCSNSIRVIKTTKQTHTENITYPKAIQVLSLFALPIICRPACFECLCTAHSRSLSKRLIVLRPRVLPVSQACLVSVGCLNWACFR